MTDPDGSEIDLFAELGVSADELIEPLDPERFDAMVDRAVDPDTPSVADDLVPADAPEPVTDESVGEIWLEDAGDDEMGLDEPLLVEDDPFDVDDGFGGDGFSEGLDGGLL